MNEEFMEAVKELLEEAKEGKIREGTHDLKT